MLLENQYTAIWGIERQQVDRVCPKLHNLAGLPKACRFGKPYVVAMRPPMFTNLFED